MAICSIIPTENHKLIELETCFSIQIIFIRKLSSLSAKKNYFLLQCINLGDFILHHTSSINYSTHIECNHSIQSVEHAYIEI